MNKFGRTMLAAALILIMVMTIEGKPRRDFVFMIIAMAIVLSFFVGLGGDDV